MRKILLTAALTLLLGAAPARACDFGSFGFGGFSRMQSFDFGGGFGGFNGGFDFGGFGAQSFAVPVVPVLPFQARSNFAFRGRVRSRAFTPSFGGQLRFRGRVRGSFGGGGFCPSCFP